MPMPVSAKEYYAVAGSRFNDSDARIIGPELDRLRDHLGREITTLDVVKAACDPRSPIRHYFEWRDDVAATGYRMGQAALMIRSVRVREVQGDEVVQDASVFVSERKAAPDGKRFYQYERPVVLASDEDRSEAVIREAVRILLGAKKRLAELRSLLVGRYPSAQKVLDSLEEFEREAA